MFVVQGLGSSKLCGLAILVAGAATVGCSAISCPPSAKPAAAPVLQVVHFEGSDGPTAWALNVYANGVLELQKYGKQSQCGRAPDRQLQKLKRLIESEDLEQAPAFDGFLGHKEWMRVVSRDGTTKGFVADGIPGGVRPVFEELDRLFWQEFGQRYNWLLLGPKSGP